MPEELQSYALTLIRSILGASDVTPEMDEAQRGRYHKRQAELLTELNTFLLDHYAASGYDAGALGLALRSALVTDAVKRARE